MPLSSLLLGLLIGLQEDPPGPSSKQIHGVAKADLWLASFEGSGRLEKWFGRESDEEKASPRLWYDREGRVGKSDPVPGLEVQVVWEDAEHRFSGVRAQVRYGSWSESGTIDAPFTVDGTTVPAGSPFQSSFRMYHVGVSYVVGVRPPDLPVEVWGWMGCFAHTSRFKMETSSGELRDGGGGLNVGGGIHGEVRPWPFLFAAGELSGGVGFGVPHAEVMISAGLAWREARIEVGYRHFWADHLEDDPTLRLSLGGPFIGASIRF